MSRTRRYGYAASQRQAMIAAALLATTYAVLQLPAAPPDGREPAAPSGIVYLQDRRVVESSGLAISGHDPEVFWTHNDSGHSARLYAFDRRGRATGGCELKGVNAIDFEDMSAFVQDGVARLMVADVGDNRSKRDFVSLYFFDEPAPHAWTVIDDWTRVDLRYPDGPRDCESADVDVSRRVVTLVTKSFLPWAPIYQTDLPARGHEGKRDPIEVRRVGALTIPLLTGMDRDPTGGDILLVNYFQLFRFAEQPGAPWWTATPKVTQLPRLKQIEAVTVDAQGQVWITSEGSPAPLARVDETADAEEP